MNAPKTVIEAAKKEVEKLQRRVDRLEFLLFAPLSRAKAMDERCLMMDSRTIYSKRMGKEWEEKKNSIDGTKEWIAWEEWKAKRKS